MIKKKCLTWSKVTNSREKKTNKQTCHILIKIFEFLKYIFWGSLDRGQCNILVTSLSIRSYTHRLKSEFIMVDPWTKFYPYTHIKSKTIQIMHLPKRIIKRSLFCICKFYSQRFIVNWVITDNIRSNKTFSTKAKLWWGSPHSSSFTAQLNL